MAVTGFEGFAVPDKKYHVITTPTVTNSGVRDIFIAADRYALMTTGSGIDVLDLQSGEIIASGTIPGEVTESIVAEYSTSFGKMYVGTSGGGVYAARYHTVVNRGENISDLLQPIFSTSTTPPISDDEIRDICVAQGFPFRLLISTGLGVDYIVDNLTSQNRSTRAIVGGSDHCHLTQADEGYWSTTVSGVETNYDLNSTSGTGIITTDFSYNTSSIPFIPTNTITDISVAEGSPNALAFATASGDFVIDERQGAEPTSPIKSFTDDPIISVDFGPNASYTAGKLYVLSTGVAMLYDLTDGLEIGSHQSTIPIIDQFLTENTRDQALLSGTQTLVRTTAVP